MTLEIFRESVTDHIGELTEDKLMSYCCNYNNSGGFFKILIEDGNVVLLAPTGTIMKAQKSVDNILAVMFTVIKTGHGIRWEM